MFHVEQSPTLSQKSIILYAKKTAALRSKVKAEIGLTSPQRAEESPAMKGKKQVSEERKKERKNKTQTQHNENELFHVEQLIRKSSPVTLVCKFICV